MFGVFFVSVVFGSGGVGLLGVPVRTVQVVAFGSLGKQKVEKFEIFKTCQNFTKTSKTLYKVVKSSCPALCWDSESSWGCSSVFGPPSCRVGRCSKGVPLQ